MPKICEICNAGRSGHGSLKLFSFPWKNAELCRKWIEKTGKQKLFDLKSQQIRSRSVCAEHFESSDFMDPAFKIRLKPFAVPSINCGWTLPTHQEIPVEGHLRVLTPEKTSSRRCGYKSPSFSCSSCSVADRDPLSMKHMPIASSTAEKSHHETPRKQRLCPPLLLHPQNELSSPCSVADRDPLSMKHMPIASSTAEKSHHETPRKQRLCPPLQQEIRKRHNKQSQISKFKEKNFIYKNQFKLTTQLVKFKFPSVQSKTLAMMQVKDVRMRQMWDKNEINLSLSMYYKSPTMYDFLRNQNMVLPAPSTIKRWLGTLKFMTGFSSQLMTQVKKKFKNSPRNDKICVVCFDEMSIIQCLEYSKECDLFEGFQDLGCLGRTPDIAKSVLVFMARGLYSNWKLPYAYFLSHDGVKHEYLAKLLLEGIEKLFSVGLLPKVVVCDPSTSNQVTFKNLSITSSQPYFYCRNRKIICIFNTPHLFKNFRDNLIANDFVLNNQVISFKDVRDTYRIDKNNTRSRVLLKIEDAHINPNSFQKMSVKLAVQVLSHSVAAAIRTCAKTGELKSDTAQTTAAFIEFLDQIFDSLNSRTLNDPNPYKCAISDNHPKVIKTLELAINTIEHLTEVDSTTGNERRPPCFDGLILTISGILSLFRDEKEHGNSFILTARLNKDPLENLFSIYRQKGGSNRNPTARTLRTSFRSDIINSLMKQSKKSNCEQDFDRNIMFGGEQDSNVSPTSETQESPTFAVCSEGSERAQTGMLNVATSSNILQTNYQTTLEECSIAYFVAYLVGKCIGEFNCNFCKVHLRNNEIVLNDQRQLLLLHRTYRSETSIALTSPSIIVCKIITKVLNYLQEHIFDIIHEEDLKKRLLHEILNDQVVEAWLKDRTECQSHKLYIIDLALLCKLLSMQSLTICYDKIP